MSFHNNWRGFLAEGSFKEKKLLREITEDELEHIDQALNEMGPEDLAFNDLFDGKNRVLIPFPTKDATSKLGKFVHFFEKAGWQVDWDKGVISGTKEFEDTSPSGMADSLFGDLDRPRTKKMKMKIGKFFSRMKNMIDKYYSLRKEVEGFGYGSGNFTGDILRDTLGEERAKQYYKLFDQMMGFVDNDRDLFNRFLRDEGKYAEELARYWQSKADYIKKNLSSLDENKYSILITRHPVDVLRMSDFDDITSCHSPPSRPQSEGSYYKCAVSEAHGHGALAYVVNNSDLEEEFGTGDLIAIEKSSAFQEALDLFYDDMRNTGAEMEPVSRLRLRQVRHFKETSKWTATGRPVEEPGVEIAVPEKKVYGVDIPGFRDKVMEWARANQEEALLSAPTRGSAPKEVNLDQFIKYGGSYEDNTIFGLVRDLYDDERFREFAKIFSGTIKQDISTQRDLEKRLTFTPLPRVQREAEGVLAGYQFKNFEVGLTYDQEDGNAYIVPTVLMKLSWDRGEWPDRWPPGGVDALRWLPNEFEDYGDVWDIFHKGEWDTRYWRSSGSVTMKVDVKKINLSGGSWLDVMDFEQMLEYLGDIESDKIEGFKNIAATYFMREGLMDGGEVDKMGEAVENDELDSGDWELEVSEGDYEPYRYELVTANMPLEISYKHTTLDMMKKIIEDRGFWSHIRTLIVKKSRGKYSSDYLVDTDRFFDEVDEVAKRLEFRLNYHIGGGDKDEIALTWKAIIETWNDAEEVEKLIQAQFDRFVRAYSPGNPQTLGEGKKLRLRNRSREERMFDKWRRFLK